jgi:hypothetical protein
MVNHFTVIIEREKTQYRTIWILFIDVFFLFFSPQIFLLNHSPLESVDKSMIDFDSQIYDNNHCTFNCLFLVALFYASQSRTSSRQMRFLFLKKEKKCAVLRVVQAILSYIRCVCIQTNDVRMVSLFSSIATRTDEQGNIWKLLYNQVTIPPLASDSFLSKCDNISH